MVKREFSEKTSELPDRLEALIREKGLNVNSFENEIEVSRGTIRKVIKDRTNLGSDKIKKIHEIYNVDLNWLVAGFGEMYTKSVNLSQNLELDKLVKDQVINLPDKIPFEEILSVYSDQRFTLIPYYDVDASAGSIQMFKDENDIPSLYVYIPGFEDCDLALNVWGDSMEPVYKTGEVVICKKVNNPQLILYGEAYLVVTDEFRTIKYLQPAGKPENLLLVSENDFYQPVEIARKDIIHLFRVKGKINRNAI